MTSVEGWVKQCLGKKKYRTNKFAQTMVSKIKQERNVVLYTYRCPTCQGFHLTKRNTALYQNQPIEKRV